MERCLGRGKGSTCAQRCRVGRAVGRGPHGCRQRLATQRKQVGRALHAPHANVIASSSTPLTLALISMPASQPCPPGPQALEATQPSLKDLLSHPGYTATLLVPTDDAFDAALAKYGEWPEYRAGYERRCGAGWLGVEAASDALSSAGQAC